MLSFYERTRYEMDAINAMANRGIVVAPNLVVCKFVPPSKSLTYSGAVNAMACQRICSKNHFARTGLVEGDPSGALKGFEEVVKMEGEKGEW